MQTITNKYFLSKLNPFVAHTSQAIIIPWMLFRLAFNSMVREGTLNYSAVPQLDLLQ